MIKGRIIKYIEYKGISKYKFYQITGLSNGFLDKEGAIGSDKCEIIIYHFPEIDARWLLTGTGNMISDTNVLDTSMSSTGASSADDTIYKEMLKEKEKEIAKLNREIGRLQHAVEHLKKGGKLFGFGVEVRTELDE